MKPLKEALISKDKRNWASTSDFDIVLVMPNSMLNYKILKDMYSLDPYWIGDEGVVCFILPRNYAKEVIKHTKEDCNSYWTLKEKMDLEEIKDIFSRSDEYLDEYWDEYFNRIDYTDIK